MILAAAVCPHPPLLVRELTGLQDPAAEVRTAALAAARDVLERRPDELVLLGGAGPDEPTGLHRFGRPDTDGTRDLRLAHLVGVRLLAGAGWRGPVRLVAVDPGAGATEVDRLGSELADGPGRVGLVVLGDGSARRGARAPGPRDDRADGFDEHLVAALRAGDAAQLAGLDAALAEETAGSGRAAFRVLGAAVLAQGAAVQARLHYADDPFGVTYVVASWRLG